MLHSKTLWTPCSSHLKCSRADSILTWLLSWEVGTLLFLFVEGTGISGDTISIEGIRMSGRCVGRWEGRGRGGSRGVYWELTGLGELEGVMGGREGEGWEGLREWRVRGEGWGEERCVGGYGEVFKDGFRREGGRVCGFRRFDPRARQQILVFFFFKKKKVFSFQ